jgi:hypothetical protein
MRVVRVETIEVLSFGRYQMDRVQGPEEHRAIQPREQRTTCWRSTGVGSISVQSPLVTSFPRSTDLAAVGSGSPVVGAGRDNLRDSSTSVAVVRRRLVRNQGVTFRGRAAQKVIHSPLGN